MERGEESEDWQNPDIDGILDRFSEWVIQNCELDLTRYITWVEVISSEVKIVLTIEKKEYRVFVLGNQMDVTALASFLKTPR